LVFSKKTANYYPIKESRNAGGAARVGKGCIIRKSNTGKREALIGLKEKNDRICDELRYPSSVKYFNTQVGLHPTQKPTDLFEYLIKTYTNEGELVLDNTAGSCTTAIACLNTKRNYICMEMEQKYYEIGLKRVSDWHKINETNIFK